MKPSQPSQTLTASIFEIVQHEDSTLTVDGKIEIFVHGRKLEREVIEAAIDAIGKRLFEIVQDLDLAVDGEGAVLVIDAIGKRLRGQLRDDLPR